jgi:hypothetical protein
MNDLDGLKHQVLTLLHELERINSNQPKHMDLFFLSDLRVRVNQFCQKHNITIDVFCDLAGLSKTTLYKAFRNPDTCHYASINAVLAVLGGYEILAGKFK